MSSGRVPRGVSEYCSCLTRRSSAQHRGAPSGSLDPVDTMSSGRVQSGVSKRRRCVRYQKDNFSKATHPGFGHLLPTLDSSGPSGLQSTGVRRGTAGAQLRGAPASASVPSRHTRSELRRSVGNSYSLAELYEWSKIHGDGRQCETFGGCIRALSRQPCGPRRYEKRTPC